MKLRKTIASIIALGSLGVGADVAVGNFPTLPDQAHTIAQERVEVRQRGNVVEAELPWKGERGITIRKDFGKPTPAERIADKRKQEPVVDTSSFGEGGIKFDIILNEKPDTNRFCYSVEGWEAYNWYYQPPLTQEELDNGTERPENIVGSYAVYHKTLKNNEYKTGKAFHVERPAVWEVGNIEETAQWADLSFEEGDLCVTAPQDFLDTATYPVRIDPTFGYTSVGASQLSSPQTASPYNSLVGSFFSLTEAGDISTIDFYGYVFCGGPGCSARTGRGGLYDASLNFEGQTAEATLPSTAGWTTLTYSPDLSETTATHGVVIFAKSTLVRPGIDSSSLIAYYDSGTTGQGIHQYSSLTYPTFPDPATNGCADFGVCDAKFSIYATYTASGGGGGGEPDTRSKPVPILFD